VLVIDWDLCVSHRCTPFDRNVGYTQAPINAEYFRLLLTDANFLQTKVNGVVRLILDLAFSLFSFQRFRSLSARKSISTCNI